LVFLYHFDAFISVSFGVSSAPAYLVTLLRILPLAPFTFNFKHSLVGSISMALIIVYNPEGTDAQINTKIKYFPKSVSSTKIK